MNTAWIFDEINNISQIGMTVNGVTRLAFSEDDLKARAYLKKLIDNAKKGSLKNLILKNIKIEKINYAMSIILNRKRMDYVDVEENIEKILCNTNSSSFL